MSVDPNVTEYPPKITNPSVVYNSQQVSENNKVPSGQGFLLSVNAEYGGVDTDDATALDTDIRLNKTSYARRTKLTGAMPENGAANGYISTVDQVFQIAEGYHNGNGTVQISAAEQAKIIASNIKAGVMILGQLGTYTGGGGGGGATPYTLSVSLDDCTMTGVLEFSKQMTSGTYTAAKAAYDSGARVDLALSGGVTVPGRYSINGTLPLTAQVRLFQWVQTAYITLDGSNYVYAMLSATLSSSDVFTVNMANVAATAVFAVEDATPVSDYEFMYNAQAGIYTLSAKMLTGHLYPRLTFTISGSPTCDCFIKTSGHDSSLDMDYVEGEMLLPNFPSTDMYVLFDVKVFSDNTLHLYITDILSVNH